MTTVYTITATAYTVDGSGRVTITHEDMRAANTHEIDLAQDSSGAPGAIPAGTLTVKKRPVGFPPGQLRQLYNGAGDAALSVDLAAAAGPPAIVVETAADAIVLEWTASTPAEGTVVWLTARGRR